MGDYVIGPSNARNDHARLETKPGQGTGSGYERWRSWEFRPSTPRRGKEDVFVPVHRLLAVVACYPEDMALSDIQRHMIGKDVHHTAPEIEADRGIKWDNRPDAIEVIDHARHSTITQAEMRAWAEDAKREKDAESPGEAEKCSVCGTDVETPATTVGLSGVACLSCASERAKENGTTVEVR